jgi:hypothetical protein
MEMHYHMASRSYQKLSVDLLLVMPSTMGLTPCKDLPKFAKEMEDSQKTEGTTGKIGDTSVKQNAL